MKREWKQIESNIVYQNKWLSVREDKVLRPDGTEGIYSVLDKNPGVMIIAMDKDENIFFIKQTRYPANNETLIELPAGSANTNTDDIEILKQDAARELLEEIGLVAKEYEYLGFSYPNSGHSSVKHYAFLAKDVENKNLSNLNQEGDEAINEIFTLTIPEIKEKIANNEITCGPTLISLNFLFTKYNY